MLRHHFRCVSRVIAYCKRLVYRDQLVPSRSLEKSPSVPPIACGKDQECAATRHRLQFREFSGISGPNGVRRLRSWGNAAQPSSPAAPGIALACPTGRSARRFGRTQWRRSIQRSANLGQTCQRTRSQRSNGDLTTKSVDVDQRTVVHVMVHLQRLFAQNTMQTRDRYVRYNGRAT
jgi:hypothetical protein